MKAYQNIWILVCSGRAISLSFDRAAPQQSPQAEPSRHIPVTIQSLMLGAFSPTMSCEGTFTLCSSVQTASFFGRSDASAVSPSVVSVPGACILMGKPPCPGPLAPFLMEPITEIFTCDPSIRAELSAACPAEVEEMVPSSCPLMLFARSRQMLLFYNCNMEVLTICPAGRVF